MTSTNESDNSVFNDDVTQSTLGWLRGFRFNGIAAFDLIATLISAYIMALGVQLLNQFSTRWITFILFIILMVSAIAIHVSTGTPTMLNHFLGLNTLEEVNNARIKRGESVS